MQQYILALINFELESTKLVLFNLNPLVKGSGEKNFFACFIVPLMKCVECYRKQFYRAAAS